MKIIAEVLLDPMQLNPQQREHLQQHIADAVEQALGTAFWYRSGVSFDHELTTKIEEH